jgi:hypothetical protein
MLLSEEYSFDIHSSENPNCNIVIECFVSMQDKMKLFSDFCVSIPKIKDFY